MALSYGPKLGLLVNGIKGEEHYLPLMKLYRGIDALVQPTVDNVNISTPPINPNDGVCYILSNSSTGAFTGHNKHVARYSTVLSGWEFYVPQNGWEFYNKTSGTKYKYDGSTWSEQVSTNVELSNDSPIVNGIATAGVGTTASRNDHVHPTDTTRAAASDLLTVAKKDVANTFTKSQTVTPVTITVNTNTTINIDASLSNNFHFVLNESCTIGAPTNLVAGQILNFKFTQDATGGRTVAFTSLFLFQNGTTAPVVTTSTNAVDFASCYYDGTNIFISISKNFGSVSFV